MIIRPAIDIREGQCVQLVGGSYEDELLRLPDPIAVCQDWISKGFERIHIIDLDRATNRGNNIEVVKELCVTNPEIDFRVGGGIRTSGNIKELIASGAKNVVVGTKAILEPEWFFQTVEEFPSRIYVALEVDGREVKVSGWTEKCETPLIELLKKFGTMDLAGVFVTAIHKEGRRQGTDLDLFKMIRELTPLPVVASGGVTTMEDIEALERIGIEEVVLGAAIYTDPEFSMELQERIKNSRKTKSDI